LARLRHKSLHLSLDEKAKEFLVEKGYDPEFGAPDAPRVERFLEDRRRGISRAHIAGSRADPGHARRRQTGLQPESATAGAVAG